MTLVVITCAKLFKTFYKVNGAHKGSNLDVGFCTSCHNGDDFCQVIFKTLQRFKC
jgi:hypothetical protein